MAVTISFIPIRQPNILARSPTNAVKKPTNAKETAKEGQPFA